MAIYNLLDFSDIIAAVQEELKIASSDTTNLNRIKRAINNTYINEVAPASRWFWLYGHTSSFHKSYFSNGTASVTPGSTSVTLSVAPGASDGDSGSFLNWNFSVNGKNEIYKISAHTALATAVTLDRAFNNDLDSAAEFKIWPDFVTLPTDLRETIEVWHDHVTTPLQGKGLQEFRTSVQGNPKLEGRPGIYSTYDFHDPSSGDGETESDRYRTMKVWPSISTYKTMLRIDYIKKVDPLENDGDEPLMPIEDRIVLVYGALAKLWRSIGRSTEDAQINDQLFREKLGKMLGKITDSFDKPRIEPQSEYIRARRGSRGGVRGAGAFGGGGSSTSSPTYAENITINGASLTGNMTVSPGITIDGVDVSILNASVTTLDADLDLHIADTSTHGTTGNVVGTTDSQTLTNKTIDADSNTITNIEDGDIKTGAAITRSKLASGTNYRILANNSSGVMSENAAINANNIVMTDSNGQLTHYGAATLLHYLDEATELTAVNLNDNQASASNIFTVDILNITAAFFNYSIKRGTNVEAGQITLITDGTSASLAVSGTSLGTTGVTLSADISTGNMRLRYTSTSTGTAPIFLYNLISWYNG